MLDLRDAADAYRRIERHIWSTYGISVDRIDVLDPNTGDFNGESIHIDHALDQASALFVLIHLFGHTVQWNTSEEFRRLGMEVKPGIDDETLAKIYEYERHATQFSMKLMEEAGVTGLNRWVSDMFDADWRFLEHFYRTGERLEVKSLLRPGTAELLTPIDIPAFTPQRWVSRWSF